jgi:hypothetical protein
LRVNDKAKGIIKAFYGLGNLTSEAGWQLHFTQASEPLPFPSVFAKHQPSKIIKKECPYQMSLNSNAMSIQNLIKQNVLKKHFAFVLSACSIAYIKSALSPAVKLFLNSTPPPKM